MYDQSVEPVVSLDDRPIRETIIEKDEIFSLIIDVETLNSGEFYKKYFA
jgi:hypothetical protein